MWLGHWLGLPASASSHMVAGPQATHRNRVYLDRFLELHTHMAHLAWTKNLDHERSGLSMDITAQQRFLLWQSHSHWQLFTLASPSQGLSFPGWSFNPQILTKYLLHPPLQENETFSLPRQAWDSHWCHSHFSFSFSNFWGATSHAL